MAKSELYRYSIRLPEYMNDFVIKESDRKGLSRNQLIVACIDRIIHEQEQLYAYDKASKQMNKELDEMKEVLSRYEQLKQRSEALQAQDGQESAGA